MHNVYYSKENERTNSNQEYIKLSNGQKEVPMHMLGMYFNVRASMFHPAFHHLSVKKKTVATILNLTVY